MEILKILGVCKKKSTKSGVQTNVWWKQTNFDATPKETLIDKRLDSTNFGVTNPTFKQPSVSQTDFPSVVFFCVIFRLKRKWRRWLKKLWGKWLFHFHLHLQMSPTWKALMSWNLRNLQGNHHPSPFHQDSGIDFDAYLWAKSVLWSRCVDFSRDLLADAGR